MSVWIVAMGIFLGGCRKKAESNDIVEEVHPQSGGTLIYGKNGSPITLDPAYIEETESSVIAGNLFEGLVGQRAGQVAIDPGLANSWKISPDAKTYTFNLRSGATFHDGTPINSEAVLFSIEIQKKLDDAKGGSGVMYKSLNIAQILKEIRAVNDSVVEFELYQPDATFLNIMSLQFMSVISPTAFKKAGESWSRNPVGAGPFKFVSWDSTTGTVRLAAFENYWKGRPYLDSAIFMPIPNVKERWLALKEGRITMMADPDQKDMAEIETTPGIKTLKQPGINVSYIGMNMTKKPFDNLKVREAINLAINRESLVKAVFGQMGRPAKNPIPPSLLGYNNEIRPIPYDPARAKKLLAEAGFPNGFKCKFWGLPLVREYLPNPKLAAEMIIADLALIGIQTDYVVLPWKELLQRRGRGEHEITLSGWVGDAPDPHFFFYPLLDKEVALQKSSTNVSFYKSDEMHKLIQQGKETADPVERSNIYKKACDLFNRDMPWVDIAHAVSVVPFRDNVMDFQLHASAMKRFEKVWLKK